VTKIRILFSLSAALISVFVFGIPFEYELQKSFAQPAGNVSSSSSSPEAAGTSNATNVTANSDLSFFHAQIQVPAASRSAEGSIASIQNNQSDKPTWILDTGGWGLLVPKRIQVSQTVVPVNSGVIFTASFGMTKLDGAQSHRHLITDFNLSKFSETNTVTTYNGTATVTLKDGPRTAVPISIRIMNESVMSLWMDPTKTDNHFGNTPIYGHVRTSGIFSSFSR
jgi:hypothetical protein